MKRVSSTLIESGFQGEEGEQATRTSLGEVEESMSTLVDAKSNQDDLKSLGFTPSMAKPEIGKEVGRRRPHSQKGREKWDWGRRKPTGDDAIFCSVKAFHLVNVDNAMERKPPR